MNEERKSGSPGICSVWHGAILAVCFATFALAARVSADDVSSITQEMEAIKSGIAKPNYSPYAGRNFPTQVYWGDTHVHTNNSIDARAFGVTLGPETAYRFARANTIRVIRNDQPVKRS